MAKAYSLDRAHLLTSVKASASVACVFIGSSSSLFKVEQVEGCTSSVLGNNIWSANGSSSSSGLVGVTLRELGTLNAGVLLINTDRF